MNFAGISRDSIFAPVQRTPSERDGRADECGGRESSIHSYPIALLFYSYILKSLKDGKYYYGHTNDLTKRLEKHNKGQVKATKYRIPFVLHHFESFPTKKEANQRELFYKTIEGYIYLKRKNII